MNTYENELKTYINDLTESYRDILYCLTGVSPNKGYGGDRETT